MSLFISSPSIPNVLARVLSLSDSEAVRILSAETRESIEDILTAHEVPAATNAVRFVHNDEKHVVVVNIDDTGCHLVPEMHPDAFAF